ncbi:hypothetical protein I4U23_006783 [Adineta vaga]|nr:hypothetical protein I4U23_006783 [Adineta vaga]
MVSPFDYFTDSSNTKSDIVLIVDNERFYCHRLLLSLVSPVFTRMFDGEFQEHNAQEIVLQNKTSESILELLKYIYPQFHGEITNDNLEDLLLLADEYMIEHLKQPCKDLLMKQLVNFQFVLLPTEEKLEQRSLKSKNFHTSDLALDSSRHPNDEPTIHTNRIYSSHRSTTNIRRSMTKSTSTYLKSSEKTTNSSRYILFLDKTRLPHFYDEHDRRMPFTTTNLELWLHRLRILYQIDKGREYGEVIDRILSIFQFIPTNLLSSALHITMATYRIDEIMLNDIARARMYMFEEWTTDGDPYRSVNLTESYRLLSSNSLILMNEQSMSYSINKSNDEQIHSQETILNSSFNVETIPLDFQFEETSSQN